MVPALQFDDWQWASLDAGHAGRGLGRLAVPPRGVGQPRHGATTMDTLVSLGVLAAFGWSVVALFFGTAGMPA